MIQKYRNILDIHQQHRETSCFQMAPELALKFGGVLELYDSPFQNHHCWDGKGFEPYAPTHIVGEYLVTFDRPIFQSPYEGFHKKLEEELTNGCFPVLSLQPPNTHSRHGYVVLEQVSNKDFLVVTKIGSLRAPPCLSNEDMLSNRIANGLQVDCLFWKAADKTPA